MISIIVAIAEGGVIGGNNSLLWHISEDLRRFKQITLGHPVIMGRKTYESIGRPLPNRDNIIISRNGEYQAEGCKTVGSLSQAISLYPADQEIFIIGGGEIYRQSMDMADKLYITEVEAQFDGDTFFPEIDPAIWQESLRQRYERGEKFDSPFSFVEYIRKK